MREVKGGPPDIEFDPQTERLFSLFIRHYRNAAIGSLVKGIAHNLNGALQVLSMRIELLEGVLTREKDDRLSAALEKTSQCLEQVHKMKGMIDILIRKGIQDSQEVGQKINLNELLDEELSLLKNNLFFKHQVVTKKMFDPRIPGIEGSYLDFSQAISNIIVNAVEAMADSPKRELTVSTENLGNEVRVSIRDTGCGLSEDVRQNIFKPFFTTKGGEHAGLGLFLASRVLMPYGASIFYDSNPCETTFGISFPL